MGRRFGGVGCISSRIAERMAPMARSCSNANHSMSWSYDAPGRVVGTTQTVGTGSSAVTKSVTYGYTNGQITSIAINGKPLLSQVLYQPFGPVSGWTWVNNTNEARVYYQTGNLTNLESAEGFTYSYDSAFRITGITDTDNASLTLWGFFMWAMTHSDPAW